MRKSALIGLVIPAIFYGTFCGGMEAEATEQKPIVSFGVVSDIHLQSRDLESQRKFTHALQDLQQINPDADALVVNGDFTNGKEDDYYTLRSLLTKAPHPQQIFFTIGNHEFYQAWCNAARNWDPEKFPNGETENASINRFLSFAGRDKVYFDRWLHGYHFIFLGSEQYRQSNPENQEDAYLSQRQLNWLKQVLAKETSRKPAFVFLHQPLPNTVSATDLPSNQRGVVQHEELKKILSGHKEIFFFTGHTHWELKMQKTLVNDRFTMVNSSSVRQPWTSDGKGGEKFSAANASEGLYVEVFEDKVLIKGRDFSDNMWVPEAQFTLPVNNH